MTDTDGNKNSRRSLYHIAFSIHARFIRAIRGFACKIFIFVNFIEVQGELQRGGKTEIKRKEMDGGNL